MAELADAADLKSAVLADVRVRVPLRACIRAGVVRGAVPGRANGRQTEEIDIVGMGRSRATIIGECKWISKPLSVSILAALNDHKIPALRQNGVNVAAEPEILASACAGQARARRRTRRRDAAPAGRARPASRSGRRSAGTLAPVDTSA
jgi:hypothetical protein